MNKKHLHWFPCEPAKLLGALAEMKPPEGYVYTIILLRIYERGGPIPDTLDALATRTRFNRHIVSNALDSLFKSGRLYRAEGGGIMNPVASGVLGRTNALRAERKRAGEKGATRRWEKPELNQTNGHGKPIDLPMANDGYLHLHLEEERTLFPKKEITAPTAPEVVDVRTDLFRRGLDILKRISGQTDKGARSLIGGWLKSQNDDAVAVLRVIEDAERERMADPVAWIIGCLKHRGGLNGKYRQSGGQGNQPPNYAAIAQRIRSGGPES